MGNINLPDTLYNGTQYNKKVMRMMTFLNDKNVIDTSAPVLPYIGQEYYNKTTKVKSIWDGQVWQEITGPGSSPTFASVTVTGNITVGGTVDGLDLQAHTHGGANQGGTVAHGSLSDKGTNTHATIDSHLGSTSNPHSVTKTQVSLGNVTDDAQVKRSEYTAKGHLLGGTGAGTLAGLAIGGTNGHVLKVDSTQATGMAWGAPDVTGGDHGVLVGLGDDDHAQYLLVAGTRAMTGDLTLPATKKVILDGAGASSYIVESADNVVDVYAGGTKFMSSTTTVTTFPLIVAVQGDLQVTALKKVLLDGSSGHTYLVESADGVLDVYAGTVNTIKSTATAVTLAVDTTIVATKKLLLTADGGTYLIESADNVLDVYVGTVKTISSTATAVSIAVDTTITATKKLLLAGDGGTYLVESADNILGLYTSSAVRLTLNSDGITVAQQVTITGASRVRVRHEGASGMVLTNATDTVLVFNTEDWDNLGEYNTSTGRFTPGKAGYYVVFASMLTGSYYWGVGTIAAISIYKNGGLYVRGNRWVSQNASIPQYVPARVYATVYLNGAGDYIDIRGYQTIGDISTIADGTYNFLDIHRLS